MFFILDAIVDIVNYVENKSMSINKMMLADGICYAIKHVCSVHFVVTSEVYDTGLDLLPFVPSYQTQTDFLMIT